MTFQLILTFFGLTPSYKAILLDEIHTLCYFGNGGFTHSDVYDMPIRYRHYHLKKISEYVEKQNEAVNKKNGQSEVISPSKVQIPDFATKVRAPKK